MKNEETDSEADQAGDLLARRWEAFRRTSLAYIARPTNRAKAARDAAFSAFAAAYAPEFLGAQQ